MKLKLFYRLNLEDRPAQVEARVNDWLAAHPAVRVIKTETAACSVGPSEAAAPCPVIAIWYDEPDSSGALP